MSTDLVITATPPHQKEVPVRPSSTGTCSSANTSLSGSIGNSPNSDDADDSISPTRKGTNTKKGRTIYKAQQVVVLEQVFSRTHYPDADFVERLARDLNISESKIKVGTVYRALNSTNIIFSASTFHSIFVLPIARSSWLFTAL